MFVTNRSVPARFRALVPSRKGETKIPVHNTRITFFIDVIKFLDLWFHCALRALSLSPDVAPS